MLSSSWTTGYSICQLSILLTSFQRDSKSWKVNYRLNLYWKRITREIQAESWYSTTFLADQLAWATISGSRGVHVPISQRQTEPHCIPVGLHLTCSLGFHHPLPQFILQGSIIFSSWLFFRAPPSSPPVHSLGFHLLLLLPILQGSTILFPCPFFKAPSSSPLSVLHDSIILPSCPFFRNYFFLPNDQAELFFISFSFQQL